MFHGGTNFHFINGANRLSYKENNSVEQTKIVYKSSMTSYGKVKYCRPPFLFLFVEENYFLI